MTATAASREVAIHLRAAELLGDVVLQRGDPAVRCEQFGMTSAGFASCRPESMGLPSAGSD
jgi:hypothetical protein